MYVYYKQQSSILKAVYVTVILERPKKAKKKQFGRATTRAVMVPTADGHPISAGS